MAIQLSKFLGRWLVWQLVETFLRWVLRLQYKSMFKDYIWDAAWQNQQNDVRLVDSDQPGHPPSLISVFAVRMKKQCVVGYPLSAQRRLIRMGGCPVSFRYSNSEHCVNCSAGSVDILSMPRSSVPISHQMWVWTIHNLCPMPQSIYKTGL